MKTWQAVLVGGAVFVALTQSETEAPGSTGRGAANVRASVAPLLEQGAGAVGDAVTVVRNEAGRQGINPTGVFSAPTTELGGRDVESIPSPGLPAGSGG